MFDKNKILTWTNKQCHKHLFIEFLYDNDDIIMMWHDILSYLPWGLNITPVGEKEVSLPQIRKGFGFVPGLFGIVLRGGYLYGAWPRTVLILIEFEFIIPELWQLVVFCTCRILPEGLKFVENFPLQILNISKYWIIWNRKSEQIVMSSWCVKNRAL